MTLLTDTARAKVNLTLRVLGRRDDGYHDIESVVAFADVADNLAFDATGELSLKVSGPRASACGDEADNLVVQAALLLAERVPGLKLGRFILEKQLPVAAGIGGGSADAAAALRLLARANGIALDDPRLFDVARETGADIPVCLGSLSSIMSGVGEAIVPLSLPQLHCVLVNPGIGVATKDVFSALGLRRSQLLVGAADVIGAEAAPDASRSHADWLKFLSHGTNSLEAPALEVEPAIGGVLDILRACEGAELVRMSGSGATCFAIFADDKHARTAGAAISAAHPSWWVHAGTLG